ncbi:Rho GTPase (Miro-like) [Legionella lansingensis]|uniref:Rho GTPase (Miro-like) n=1 Tax=Legionella lansingensis TaxID=45067 RepID=A0A0W0VZF4_9GAMM|nr:ADP-ribosylation factor-like protein [Legionella lansingensis]KTD25464.1 Rho GTPase (Miro-like) [Legionella lansingensis]SNV51496.1 Rho GTPase (Miro-like) [Legionella lansingensis]
MTDVKIVMMGETGSGKTELAKALTGKSFSDKYKTTSLIGFLHKKYTEINLQIWDTSAKTNAENTRRTTGYANKKFALYCIDLTQPINEERLQWMCKELAEFKQKSPEGEIILVGTKGESLQKEDGERILNGIKEHLGNQGLKVSRTQVTSAKENHGIKELLTLVLSPSKISSEEEGANKEQKQEKTKKKVAFQLPDTDTNDSQETKSDAGSDLEDKAKHTSAPTTSSEIHENLDGPSILVEARGKLEQAMIGIDSQRKEAIDKELKQLIQTVEQKAKEQDTTGIQEALKSCLVRCQIILEGPHPLILDEKHPQLMKLIISLVTTIAITCAVAMIGFGIGFAAGSWTGPGAFLSGLVTGGKAAVTVATSSTVSGVGAGSLTAWGLFSQPKEMDAIKTYANEICNNGLTAH